MKISTPALVIYLMADTDTAELARAAVEGGATALEIGIPYSDPLADGPTIQRAANRSLAAGMTTRRALEVIREIRSQIDVPIVPMTYAGPVMAFGEAEFCAAAADAGTDGLIVPDVPSDEAGPLLPACHETASTWCRCSPPPAPTRGSRWPAPGRRASSTSCQRGRHHRRPSRARRARRRADRAHPGTHRSPPRHRIWHLHPRACLAQPWPRALTGS